MTNEMKKEMFDEALRRLELLGVDEDSIDDFRESKVPPKSYADIDTMRVRRSELTQKELGYIEEFENKFNMLVYYVIQDTGFWPDGYPFDRYSLAYVSEFKDEWEMERQDSIVMCKAIPAYIINEEEPSCSEITEFGYQNVSGLLVNLT